MTPEQFFTHLWQDYIAIAPAAARLHARVAARGERIVNDHVAFRSFDLDPIGLAQLEPHLLALGYRRFEPYVFEDKGLRAWGYVHPGGHPRIFLSELETRRFSRELQNVVAGLCRQVPAAAVADPSIFWAGRPWAPVSHATWQALRDESEYAAWVAALGLRANHFTISVNALTTFADLPALLDFVEAEGFVLNTAGGRIKGSPEVLLEQAATLADRVPVAFAGGEVHDIPTCYYEFARRYPRRDGELYEGFVAASADRIFESTDTRAIDPTRGGQTS